MKEFWDIEENKGFIKYRMNGKIVKLRNDLGDNKEALERLKTIDRFIKTLQEFIKKAIATNDSIINNCLHECIIFINTPYTLQEIPGGTSFEGINKPKGIYKKGKKCKIVSYLDNDLLAKRRHIMLKLRKSNGMLESWKNTKFLILHELAHTFCNHIRYRESGNHQKIDFEKCEKLLHLIDKQIYFVAIINNDRSNGRV